MQYLEGKSILFIKHAPEIGRNAIPLNLNSVYKEEC